jgi:hypothetical protein
VAVVQGVELVPCCLSYSSADKLHPLRIPAAPLCRWFGLCITHLPIIHVYKVSSITSAGRREILSSLLLRTREKTCSKVAHDCPKIHHVLRPLNPAEQRTGLHRGGVVRGLGEVHSRRGNQCAVP